MIAGQARDKSVKARFKRPGSPVLKGRIYARDMPYGAVSDVPAQTKKAVDMFDRPSIEIAAPDLIATQTEIAAVAPFPA